MKTKILNILKEKFPKVQITSYKQHGKFNFVYGPTGKTSIYFTVAGSAEGDIVVGGRFSTGEKFTIGLEKEVTPETLKIIKTQYKEVIKKEETDRKKNFENALKLYETYPEAVSTPYSELKQITPKNAKQDGDTLVILGTDGEKSTLIQRIDTLGKKMERGSSLKGTYYQATEGNDGFSFIVEGYADAMTIDKIRLSSNIYCAFSLYNIMAVADKIKAENPETFIVICGELDHKNNKQIKKVYDELKKKYKVIFPNFKNPQTKGTDFNDLFIEDGMDALRTQINLQDHQDKDFFPVALGYDNSEYIFFSKRTQDVYRLSELNSKTCLQLAPLSWFKDQFGFFDQKTGEKVLKQSSWANALDILVANCIQVGKYDDSKRRSYGIYKDNNDFYFNNGDSLYKIEDKLKKVDKGQVKLNHFYSKLPRRIAGIEENQPLSDLEIKQLIEVCKTLPFKSQESYKILLGWMVQAILCGCAPRRAHIWLLGNSGTGKSTIIKNTLFKKLMPYMFYIDSKAREGGMRHKVDSAALPLSHDDPDSETRQDQNQLARCIEIYRVASDGGESKIPRGRPDGSVVEYTIRNAVCMGSIDYRLEKDQDDERFIDLHMKRLPTSADATKVINSILALPDNFGTKFFLKTAINVNLFLDNYKKINEMVGKIKTLGGHRVGTISSLIAGWYTLTGDPIDIHKDFGGLLSKSSVLLEKEVSETEVGDSAYRNLLNLEIPNHSVGNYTPEKLEDILDSENAVVFLQKCGIFLEDEHILLDPTDKLKALYEQDYGKYSFKAFKIDIKKSKQCLDAEYRTKAIVKDTNGNKTKLPRKRRIKLKIERRQKHEEIV